ncbi:hypothetical protein [Martelella mediterranea]|uniref:Uncharacterized protein n=1 Tax=Martelella mediterranea TaxID=293089 RepID=A0A4R3NQX2_9HYPH|nr:hypothetical protein [Martelella mediterranea]TCT37674.1 hypothetical protein EDC90_101764 [Martelella mediterranea]
MAEREVIIASADQLQRSAEDLKQRAGSDIEYGPDVTATLARMLTSMACLMLHFHDGHGRSPQNIIHVDFGTDGGNTPPDGNDAA